MYPTLVFVALAALWSGVAVADSEFVDEGSLVKRQSSSSSGAFRPTTSTSRGTCEEEPGWGTCAIVGGVRKCYLPERGDSCCSEGYACPGGSFCLTKGYCCRNEFSIEECAKQYGVTVSAGFKTDGSTPSAQPTSAAQTSAESSAEPTPDISSTDTSTSYGTATPQPTGNGNDTFSPTASVVPFTGAGNALDVGTGGVLSAMVLVFVSLLGNVL